MLEHCWLMDASSKRARKKERTGSAGDWEEGVEAPKDPAPKMAAKSHHPICVIHSRFFELVGCLPTFFQVLPPHHPDCCWLADWLSVDILTLLLQEWRSSGRKTPSTLGWNNDCNLFCGERASARGFRQLLNSSASTRFPTDYRLADCTTAYLDAFCNSSYACRIIGFGAIK